MSDISNKRIHYAACNLCEAICGLEYHIENEQITAIKGDKNDPLSRGHICPKAVALQDIYNDPDRLRQPVRKTADGWQTISWEEAFDLVAERLVAIRKAQGANAIGAYLGNPNVHHYGSMTHAPAFLKPLKTRNRFSATSVDQLPHHLVSYWMYGHQLLIPIPDIDRTQYFLMLGANPMASNGSIMTVPDFRNRLKALQARGGKLVVIDPRRSETAQVADEYLAIRPGTDAAFLLALLNVLMTEQGCDAGRLAEFSDDLQSVATAIASFTPEYAQPVSGISADDIRRLAADLARADGGVCYGRMGVSTQAFGTLCQWAIQMINVVTANLDREGGVMFTTPAVDTIAGPASRPGHYNQWQSRVSGLPEFGGELPASVMAEEITTEGDGQMRALITIAGNPVLSTPNGRQLDEALSQLEFMVSVDIYINETTRHADVILPPTCGIEHDHYDLAFHPLAVRNTARYNQPVFEKADDSLHDWEIYNALGERISRLLDQPSSAMPAPHQILDFGLQSGPWGSASGHQRQLSLAELKQHPHGIDLGPLQSQLPERLFHQNKMIVCLPDPIVHDLQRLRETLDARAAEPGLQLIGRRHVRSNNSWMHNYQRLVKGKDRCTLLMHEHDVQALKLQDGQTVCVRSRVGTVRVKLEQTLDIMPGTVSLPHGWGHDREDIQLEIAQENAGVSVNDLTDDQYYDALSGNAAVNGVSVTVEAA